MIDEGAHIARAALERVLLLAPYRRDAEYLASLLGEHDIDVAHASEDSLAQRLADSGGVLVATHEALSPRVIDVVAAFLEKQPDWSELPVVVLLDRSAPAVRIRAQLAARWARSRQTFYERPVSAVELLSGIQAALLVRLRQREVGDHIEREIELRRELNHRVKNILASVTSIFQMTKRGATSIEDFATDFTGRLEALTNVHGAVFRADGETVPIRDIVELTFAPYRVEQADRIQTSGPDLTLSHEGGTTLALCLHELTTNAIKYGALSVPEGRVGFDWRLDDDQLSIRWEERQGPMVTEPTNPGYGTRYLRSALSGLFGKPPTLAFDAQGLSCEASGNASRIVRNQPH